MSLITSLMRMLMFLSIILCSDLFATLLITSECLRLVIWVSASCPISPLWPPTLQLGFARIGTADRRTPEHKRLLIKTTCSNPLKLRRLRGNAMAEAPVNLALFHWHTYTRSTWPDPNPAGRFYNRITDASCYRRCCSLRCLRTHNWIEEFMVSLFFFFFSWGGGVLTISLHPSIVFKGAICPARVSSSVALPQHASMAASRGAGDFWTECYF